MLNINMEFRKGLLFIRLKGELSKKTSRKLSECLDDMINENGIKYLVLNVNGLKNIEEIGINTILNHYQDIVMHNGKLVICGCDKLNNKLLMSNLLDDIYKSNTELGAFKLINI